MCVCLYGLPHTPYQYPHVYTCGSIITHIFLEVIQIYYTYRCPSNFARNHLSFPLPRSQVFAFPLSTIYTVAPLLNLSASDVTSNAASSSAEVYTPSAPKDRCSTQGLCITTLWLKEGNVFYPFLDPFIKKRKQIRQLPAKSQSGGKRGPDILILL